jgi:hypothetical protein
VDGIVDGIPVKVTGTSDEPAAKIKLYKKENGKWTETDTYVGHKLSSLRKIKPIKKSSSRLKKISETIEGMELSVNKQDIDGTYYIAPDNFDIPEGRTADDVICEVLNISLPAYQQFLKNLGGEMKTYEDLGWENCVNFNNKEEAKHALETIISDYNEQTNIEKNKPLNKYSLEKQAKEKQTNFPTKGENQKISLKNSQFPQFDWEYAAKIKEEYPEIWKKGGNIRGNEAYNHWTKARDGKFSPATLNWIKEREAWMARHEGDFRIAGVVAVMKWGGICEKGMSYMKKLINEEKKKINGGKIK